MSGKKVLGYSKAVSKAGNPYCFLYVVQPFTDFQLEKGSVGQQVDTISVFGDLMDLVTPDCVGKFVNLNYQVRNGKAFLVGLDFISSK